jgi:hypothetical protein
MQNTHRISKRLYLPFTEVKGLKDRMVSVGDSGILGSFRCVVTSERGGRRGPREDRTLRDTEA